ncbi:hypothetical protein [Pseudomonas anguilliseptica]|uniref:hypothetical protein n=1 Tax=Pseudomonas anguilliseptica TaxID=53406 RepID=UPI001428AEDB|nr:hypothetical protein [Pseudomonas anguilliseptica]
MQPKRPSRGVYISPEVLAETMPVAGNSRVALCYGRYIEVVRNPQQAQYCGFVTG